MLANASGAAFAMKTRAMIEALVIGTAPNAADAGIRKSEDAPAFSFAAAVSALETQAARSLEAHGAAPRTNAVTGDAGVATTRQAPFSAGPNTDRTPAPVQESTAPAHAEPRANKPATQTSALQANTAGQATAAPVAAAPLVAAPVAAATSVAQSATPSTNIDAAVRTADLAKARALKEAKAPAPAQKPQAPTQDFAKLLARRLDSGATQFELRLDPPSLGRVDAQLKLADDGENILALKFEHRATLELFARDETALRTALDSSGFEFTNQNVVFEIADEANSSFASAQTTLTIETAYAAPWSSGAVDISI